MIYIDNDYKCHATAAEGLLAVETDFFDGKCATYIDGHRYVPEGETWTRSDGQNFTGLMITPWVDLAFLERAQRSYEEASAQQPDTEALRAENEDMRTALEILEVQP